MDFHNNIYGFFRHKGGFGYPNTLGLYRLLMQVIKWNRDFSDRTFVISYDLSTISFFFYFFFILCLFLEFHIAALYMWWNLHIFFVLHVLWATGRQVKTKDYKVSSFAHLKLLNIKQHVLYLVYLLCMSISNWCVIPCLTRFNILLCLDIFFIWLFLFNMLKDIILFYSFRVYYFDAWLN